MRGDARAMSAFTRFGVIAHGGVRRNPIVPNDNRTGSPFDPSLTVSCLGDVIVEEIEQVFRFFALQAKNTARELPVDIQGFLPCNRVAAHNRVHVLYGLSSDDAASLSGAGEVRLLDAGMDGLERAEEGDELGGELFQRLHLADEECVSSSAGRVQKEECGQPWRLKFVGDVRMPSGVCDAAFIVKVTVVVLVFVYEMEFWIILWVPRGRVDV